MCNHVIDKCRGNESLPGLLQGTKRREAAAGDAHALQAVGASLAEARLASLFLLSYICV
jgi:hypothetical protein